MATEEEQYNVQVKLTRVSKTAYSPGRTADRIVDDLVSINVKADNAQAAIAKAIRLLENEKEETIDVG